MRQVNVTHVNVTNINVTNVRYVNQNQGSVTAEPHGANSGAHPRRGADSIERGQRTAKPPMR